jgi:hypothetical protein
VGLRDTAGTAHLFCTDDALAGDLFVGVRALDWVNNVSLPPRHWYHLTLSHVAFDTSALSGGEPRAGCLAHGQWRLYTIVTSGAHDATLDITVDVPVSAIYARRGAPPTEAVHDAVALAPLRRLSVSDCDLAQPGVWHLAVRSLAATNVGACSADVIAAGLCSAEAILPAEVEYGLTARLLPANLSLMDKPRGVALGSDHNFLCCGNYRDFIVTGIARELALRVEVEVHDGAALQAVYLKHGACGRYPDDVGPDENCVGNCEMRWLTTYNPITLEPSYERSATVTVPMGIVQADLRQAGSWYISVAAPAGNVPVNFSLRAQLIESPVIDEFIPLDEDLEAAERCGRYCMKVEVVEVDDDALVRYSAAAVARPRALWWGVAVALLCAAASARA